MAAKYPSNFFVTLDLLVTSLEEGDATLLAAMVGRGKMPAAKCDLKEKYYNAEKRSWKVPDNFGFFTIKCIDSGMGYVSLEYNCNFFAPAFVNYPSSSISLAVLQGTYVHTPSPLYISRVWLTWGLPLQV